MVAGPESTKHLWLGSKRNKMLDLETKGQGHQQLKAEPALKDRVEVGFGAGGGEPAPWHKKQMGTEHGQAGELPG